MTETVADAIRTAAERLAATSDTARLDAELLMAHALGLPRSRMLITMMREAPAPAFAGLVERRAAREPVAHITGEQEFFGLPLRVTSETLVPRGDSEVLVEAALELKPDAARVLDLGTGTGALLLAILSHCKAQGVATDRSSGALAVARDNAERLGLSARTRFVERDWTQAGWTDGLGQFDLVLCNPPYVEDDAALEPDVRDYEPASALFAGPEGLDDYRVIIPQLGKLLNPGGVTVLEIGSSQADAVAALARDSGFDVTLRHDLAGRPRALILR
ncbi:peptide chain release factor N(5)-glutamine methyltransferase [Qipengyuania gaetbuli]|uniref:peptide chain release factor N(5)-glutamine methyltransferase n=1 Tax=Qipengyuania gaetbuli TaxID=266952 RepID=UPI001CD680B2|nr:peptide chain release factor N(5)-glutamine methyltransferase [Qipengyuania gaetbuli]MCA0910365.1 peptide chain release factor N(5)-glutamine methyltransferase [Qipengyuania gaetbuli]